MKLTTKQLAQIIKEELNETLNPELKAKLDTHLQSSHPDNVRQGLFIADMYGIPITVQMISSLLKNDDPDVVIEGIEMAFEHDLKIKYYDLSQNTKTLMGVIKHPTAKESPEMMRLFALAPDTNAYILGVVARNAITPIDVLEDLLHYSSALRVKMSLAINTASTGKMLASLSKEHDLVKNNVAVNPNTLPATLDYLVNYGDKRIKPGIRDSALQNPSVSNKTLLRVAQNVRTEHPREIAISMLQARGIPVPEVIKPEMDEFERMYGDHNKVDLSGINLEDDDDYEF